MKILIEENNIENEHICGIPYTAMPIATIIAMKQKKSMLIHRKEAKIYGVSKSIEGKYTEGDACVIIQDIIISGLSILKTVAGLRRSGKPPNRTHHLMVRQIRQLGSDNAQVNKITWLQRSTERCCI